MGHREKRILEKIIGGERERERERERMKEKFVMLSKIRTRQLRKGFDSQLLKAPFLAEVG